MSDTEPQRRSRLKPELRRAQIVQEATRLIAERGYYGFGLRELADRCGIRNPSLLHHFGTKDQLLIAVLEDRDRHVEEVVVAALDRAGFVRNSPASLEQVFELFHVTAVQAAARPEILRLYAVLQAEALNPSHPAHLFFTQRQARVVQAFAGLVAPFVSDPRSTARHLLATTDGLQQEWLRADDAFDLVVELNRAIRRILAPRTI